MYNWNDFNKISKSLKKYAKVNSLSSEGFYRCAVSRAYYSVYHLLLNYAKSKGYNFRSYSRSIRSLPSAPKGHHSVLIHFLVNDPRNTQPVRLLGIELGNCKDQRVVCDYMNYITIDERYVNSMFVHIEHIYAVFPTLP